jgi:hypothetical protein
VIILFFSGLSYGQADYAYKDGAKTEFSRWFDQQVPVYTSVIYNGITYPLIVKARFGHQFFGDRKWKNGNVIYKNNLYPDVELLYDIERQQLITHPSEFDRYGIALDMQYISSFSIENDEFIRDPNNGTIYHIVYDGKELDLYAIRTKVLLVEKTGSSFEERVNYVIQNEGKTYPLKSKKLLQEIFPNSGEIHKEIKSKDAKFRLRNESLLKNYIQRFDERL